MDGTGFDSLRQQKIFLFAKRPDRIWGLFSTIVFVTSGKAAGV
jgi:hypothetical protein